MLKDNGTNMAMQQRNELKLDANRPHGGGDRECLYKGRL